MKILPSWKKRDCNKSTITGKSEKIQPVFHETMESKPDVWFVVLNLFIYRRCTIVHWLLLTMKVICALQCSFQSKMTENKTKNATATATQKLSLSSTSFGHQENSCILFFPGWRWNPKKGWLEKQGIISEVAEVGEQPSDTFQKANWEVKKYSACLG